MNASASQPQASSLTALVASPVEIARIDVPVGRRQLDPAWVEALADMLAGEGLRTPIDLVIRNDRFDLVTGRHRHAAARLLGWAAIPAYARTLEEWSGETALKLREITENLVRRELTALDRAFDIAAWRQIYVATHAVAKRGRPKGGVEEAEENSRMFATNFSDAAQHALRIDRATIFRDLKIASIGQALRERISLHAIADNQSELLQLAREPAERREAIADLLLAEPAQAATVSEAVAVLERRPTIVPPMRWEKLSATFSRLSQPQQHAFFALHAEAIEAWRAGLDAKGAKR